MKICITSSGLNLNSPVDSRFGRAQYLLILDEKGNLEKTISNPGVLARGGAGVAAAQKIIDEETKILITGNIGPNAVGVLGTTNIEIFLCPFNINVKEAFLMWKNNKLTLIKKPSVPGHFGHGPSGGRRGFNRGGRT